MSSSKVFSLCVSDSELCKYVPELLHLSLTRDRPRNLLNTRGRVCSFIHLGSVAISLHLSAGHHDDHLDIKIPT